MSPLGTSYLKAVVYYVIFSVHNEFFYLGYINEGGTLNLQRFEKFMKKLADIDLKNFEEIQDDLTYMKSKTGRKFQYHTPVKVSIL